MNIYRIYRTSIQAQVTFNGYSIVSCTGNIASLIFKNVHVDSAVFCFDGCIAHGLTFFDHDAAALDIDFTATCVTPQTVCIAVEFYVAIDSNDATLTVSHAAGCIQACSTVVLVSAIMAFDIQFHVTVYGYITTVINTNGVVITISRNVYIALDMQCVRGTLNAHSLQSVIANVFSLQIHLQCLCLHIHLIGTIEPNAVSAATSSFYFQVQGLVGYDRNVFACTNRAGCIGDRRVFGEKVLTFSINVAFVFCICTCITGQCGGEFSDRLFSCRSGISSKHTGGDCRSQPGVLSFSFKNIHSYLLLYKINHFINVSFCKFQNHLLSCDCYISFLHLPHRHLVLRTLPGLKKEEFPCTSSPSSVVR